MAIDFLLRKCNQTWNPISTQNLVVYMMFMKLFVTILWQQVVLNYKNLIVLKPNYGLRIKMILNNEILQITSRSSSSSFLRTLSDYAVEYLTFLRRIWKVDISPQRPNVLTRCGGLAQSYLKLLCDRFFRQNSFPLPTESSCHSTLCGLSH